MAVLNRKLQKLNPHRADGSTVSGILRRMVRVGKVTYADNDRHLARVYFADTDETSENLIVLDTRPFIPDYGVTQKTEPASGGAGYAEFAEHTHELTIRQWMPRVNDVVLVLYEGINNGRGYVLGRIPKEAT